MIRDFLEMQAHYLGMADSIIDQVDDSMPPWQKAQLRSAADTIRRHFAQRMGLSEMCGEEIPLGEWLEAYRLGKPLLDRRRSKMAVDRAVAAFDRQLEELENGCTVEEKMEPIQVEDDPIHLDDDPEAIDLEDLGVIDACED